MRLSGQIVGSRECMREEIYLMPFNFTCPYCFKKTLVADELAGQSGPCASCGKEVTIPKSPHKPITENVHPVNAPYVAKVDALAQRRRRQIAKVLKVLGLLAISAVLFGIGFLLLWPSIVSLKVRRDKIACMNNLQTIARALNEYAAQHGTYPPPIVYDKAGKAMHSWRVLILPQLGELDLYTSYDFEQSWDSTQNANLLARCPSVYMSPGTTGIGSEGNYFLVTGPGTLFPTSGPLSPADIGDGPSNTLLVVESDNAIWEWTRPLDIDVQNLNPAIGSSGQDTIGGTHKDGATMAFADGASGWLEDDLDPVLLKAIISPNGGEPVSPDDYQLR